MTDTQIFQLIGIIYVAVGLGGMINPGYFGRIVESFESSPALTYIAAIMATAVGYVIVSFHNVWAVGWPLIITVFGWAALTKGLALLIFPAQFMRLSGSMVKKLGYSRFFAVVALAIGLGLMYLGFLK